MNKLNKQLLDKMILEVLSEAGGQMTDQSAAELTKGMKSTESAKEVGSLTPRERKILGALRQVQTALAQKGDQASPKVLRLVQLMMDELGSGAPATGEPQ